MAERKRVAIVGAGVSGLTAIKACLEEDLNPVCFEQFDNIGGVWYYSEHYRNGQGARLYDNLISIFSKDMFAFSDFPYPDDTPTYLTNTTIYKYVESYCAKFQLGKYIQLNTKIKMIRKSPDYDVSGRWEIEYEDSSSKNYTETFDFVMLCAGFFKDGRIPEVDGMKSFTGSIKHSKTFRNGMSYKGKKVVVVGNSHSAGDISLEISKYADSVHLGVGRGTWMLPRVTDGGYPLDQIIFRRSHSSNPKKIDKALLRLAHSRLDHAKYKISPSSPPSASRYMVNDDLQIQILCGNVKVTGRLIRLSENEAEFDDGTIVKDVDSVLFSTGYDWCMDFLEEDIGGRNERLFYKMMFPMSLQHTSLVVIGCLDPDGPIPPVTELQSRLAARVFTKKHTLPPRKTMMADIGKWNSYVYNRYGRYKYKLPHVEFRDELASELRVLPSWWDLIKAGPRLAYKYYCGPAFSYHYRLWGPHPWTGARQAIDNAIQCEKTTNETQSSAFTHIPLLFLLGCTLVGISACITVPNSLG